MVRVIVIVKPPPNKRARMILSPLSRKLTITRWSAFAVMSCAKSAPAVIVVKRASSTQKSSKGLLA